MIETLNDGQLALGMGRCFDNARDYLEEATFLLEQKRFRRACALAILGVEELGKIILLGNTIALTLNDPKGWGEFWKKFINHDIKQANGIFYTLFFINQERGDEGMKAIIDRSKFSRKGFSVLEMQQLKNDCLYVKFEAEKKELVRKQISEEITKHYIEILTHGISRFRAVTNYKTCLEMLTSARQLGVEKVSDVKAIKGRQEVWDVLNISLPQDEAENIKNSAALSNSKEENGELEI